MTLKIIITIAAVWMLFRDFKRDPGDFKAVKGIHAACMILLVVYYSGNFAYLPWLINLGAAQEMLNSPLGVIPSTINFVSFIIQVSLSVVAFFCVASMLNRNDKARFVFIRIVPLLILLESIAFLRGWLSDGPSMISSGWIFLGGLFFYGIIGIGLIVFYTRAATKEFFSLGPFRLNTHSDTQNI